jgi:prevent-host-death family protein
MTFSAKDLRFKISMLFDILDNKEDIVITYRGKPKAKLIPYNDNFSQKKEDKLFGLWSDRDFDIDEHIRNLRKGRVFE